MTTSESDRATLRYYITNEFPVEELVGRLSSKHVKAAKRKVQKSELWAEKMIRKVAFTKIREEKRAAGLLVYADYLQKSKERDWHRWFDSVPHFEGRDRARMLVRMRDLFQCQECGDVRTPQDLKAMNEGIIGMRGKSKLFDVHHTNGECGKHSRKYDSTEDLSGMITLCHHCHFLQPDHSQRLPQNQGNKPGNDAWRKLDVGYTG